MARINGMERDVLTETLGELEKDPALGKAKFRATNQWLGGTKNVNRVHGFHAVKQEMTHPETYEITADEPTILAGTDSAPTPVEYLLAALASCVTSSMVLHATVQGIEIRNIECEIEGDIDLNGLAGLQDVPKGFQQIRVRLSVESDADADTLRQLAEFSPTLSTVRRGATVELEVDGHPERAEPPQVHA